MRILGLSFVELGVLIGGILILQDRGTSWMFILGIALLSVGANRLARSL